MIQEHTACVLYIELYLIIEACSTYKPIYWGSRLVLSQFVIYAEAAKTTFLQPDSYEYLIHRQYLPIMAFLSSIYQASFSHVLTEGSIP